MSGYDGVNRPAQLTDFDEVLKIAFNELITDIQPTARNTLLSSAMMGEPTSEDIQGAGWVQRYRVGSSNNTRNIGIVGTATTAPRATNQRGYQNVRWQNTHVPTLITPAEYLRRDAKFMVEEFTDMSMGLLLDSQVDFLDTRYFQTISNRQGCLADVITVGTPVDNTTDSQYEVALGLGVRTIMGAFSIRGRNLHIAAVPAGVAKEDPIVTLRNFSVPAQIVATPTMNISGSSGVYYNIKIALPYDTASLATAVTSTNKAGILNEANTIATTDLITFWGGSSTNNTTMPTGGPNYGLMGLQNWFTSGSNIETATGAVTAALTDRDSTSIDRSSTRYNWYNTTSRLPAAGTGTVFALSDLDNLFGDLRVHDGGPQKRMILMNPIMLEKQKTAVGISSIRTMEQMSDVSRQRLMNYGLSGVAYQGLSSEPILIAEHEDITLDTVYAIEPGMFSYLSPDGPDWLPSDAGGIWRNQTNTSGIRTFNYEAHRTQHVQNILKSSLVPESVGAVVNTKPV